MPDSYVHVPESMRKLSEAMPRDVMRDLLSDTLSRVMSAEVEALCNAAYGSRTGERENSRNGYRERDLETRMGTIPLQIPKLRRGSYLPSFLEPRRRWEKAFVQVVSEAYVLGVSTRKVEDLVEAMGAKGMSRSEVSRMAESLDEQVRAFRGRPLEKPYPYVWLDALYVRVREGGRTVSKAVLVATGVAESGEREVLGISVASGEMMECWKAFLEDLVKRKLRGVKLVISDAHTGLRAAMRAVLNGTAWQRCTVHFLRNLLALLPKSAQGFSVAAFRMAFMQSSMPEARELYHKAIALIEAKHPRAAECAREAEEDVLAHMTFPQAHWRQIRSTNPLERLNKEIRRRTDVVGIFPSDDSVLRLVTMLLCDQSDEWCVGRRYFSQESMKHLAAPERDAVASLVEVAAK